MQNKKKKLREKKRTRNRKQETGNRKEKEASRTTRAMISLQPISCRQSATIVGGNCTHTAVLPQTANPGVQATAHTHSSTSSRAHLSLSSLLFSSLLSRALYLSAHIRLS